MGEKTKNQIDKLPETSGVYFLKNSKGAAFYIGKGINIKKRVQNHFQRPTYWDKFFIDKVEKIGYTKTDSETEALLLESQLIKKHRPKYNIMLRDDKQYFYIGFSKDKLPVLNTTHQPTSIARFIGPFTDGKALKIVLRYLRKVFPYYTKAHRKLPCSYCHIDLCPGPDPNVSEYKKSVSKIKAILRGQKPRVITSLKKEMAQTAKNFEFEKAAKIKSQIEALENIFAHRSRAESSILSSGGFEGCFGMVPRSRVRLGEGGQNSPSLGASGWAGENDARRQMLKTRLRTIEAYDISNIQGREAVASMVRFDNGKPNKSFYRKFKIRLPEKPNDVAMIKEVVRRRLAHAEWPYPDLFLIDGGRAQLNAALAALSQFSIFPPSPRLRRTGKSQFSINDKMTKFSIAALAKKPDRLFFPGESKGIPLTDLPPILNHLLTYARDEAHRFAITYHRKLHRKQSVL